MWLVRSGVRCCGGEAGDWRADLASVLMSNKAILQRLHALQHG